MVDGDDKFNPFAEEKDKSEKAEKDKPWWTEMMRELALTGMATFFMTEDSVRGYIKDLKLPKEIVALLLDSVSKKKDDFYGLMAKEVGRMMAKIDITSEVSRFLEKHHIHVEAKFSFEPKKNTPATSDKTNEGPKNAS
jgi:hypothetical protein